MGRPEKNSSGASITNSREDGHDLRACAIEDRKALLHDIVGAAGGPRLVTVDHVIGKDAALFEAVRQLGAEGIVSKRATALIAAARAATG